MVRCVRKPDCHYRYVYDGKGNIGRSIDLTAGKEYNYTYENDVLVRAAEFTITVNADGLVTEKVPVDSVTYTYNTDGKLVKKRILPADGAERLIYYEASDAEETIVRINTGERTVLFHGKTDSFGRKEFDEMQLGGKGYLSRQFSYHEGVITQEHEEKEKLKSSPTTSLVSRITFTNGRTLSYEYDEEERITKVLDSLGDTTEYTYDALGQLWTEKVNGVVVNDMEYDNYGNITKKNGIQYTYGDGQWKDLLTGYGSQTIAYDAQGNPTSYLGHTLTWEKGRQLKTLDNNTYTYNANGIRTGKTVNGVTHTYQLEGTGILRESWKENDHTYELIPLYDNENSVCGIIYEDATYYFQKNLQGDVIALVDANAQVAARYTYDAWGSVTGVKTKDGAAITDTAHIAHVNPFRYRGYYLDRETGLYYLQSRYYDPVVGRFVNGDVVELLGLDDSVVSYNLFAYCKNNCINASDPGGYTGLEGFFGAFLASLIEAVVAVLLEILKIVFVIGIVVAIAYVIVQLFERLNKHIKKVKDKALATSLATLASFAVATPPPSDPDDPDFKGTKTDGSVKLYEKEGVRVEVENMGKGEGNVHLQIKNDGNKYYYNVKDMQFYTDIEFTNVAPGRIQSYLNNQKIADAIIKGLKVYLGFGA